MPNWANPTTLTMTERRKDELAEVASRRRLVVLEDDASLRQPSQRRKTLFSRLPESTVYLSGTTRLLAPGLRATYVCAPESVRDRFLAGLHHAAIKASPLDAEILGELVLSGEAESILSAKAIEAAKEQSGMEMEGFELKKAEVCCVLPNWFYTEGVWSADVRYAEVSRLAWVLTYEDNGSEIVSQNIFYVDYYTGELIGGDAV